MGRLKKRRRDEGGNEGGERGRKEWEGQLTFLAVVRHAISSRVKRVWAGSFRSDASFTSHWSLCSSTPAVIFSTVDPLLSARFRNSSVNFTDDDVSVFADRPCPSRNLVRFGHRTSSK